MDLYPSSPVFIFLTTRIVYFTIRFIARSVSTRSGLDASHQTRSEGPRALVLDMPSTKKYFPPPDDALVPSVQQSIFQDDHHQ